MRWSWLLLLMLLACREDASEPRKALPRAAATAVSSARGVAAAPAVPAAPSAPGRPASKPSASAVEDFDVETVDDEPDDDVDAACAPLDPALKPLQLLRFRFADGIEGREPKARLRIARPGQRVYAHFTLRNRSGRRRCVRLAFYVGKKKRTEITLKIGTSWSWRTWGYNTVRSDDRGILRLVATDDQGVVIVDEKLGIVPEPRR